MNDIEASVFTDRFALKVLKPEDVTETYLSWFSSIEDVEFITHRNFHALDDLKQYVLSKLQNENAIMWGIYTSDDQHIGNIKYEPINLELGFAVMGILIGNKKWHGRGVAAEVILATSSWLKKSFRIQTIALGVDKENIAAIRAYQKIGFKESSGIYIELNNNGSEMVLQL